MNASIRKAFLRSVLLLCVFVAPVSAERLDYRSFADCITASGAKYYAAHWCPYCRKQNRVFGSDWKYLPYIECSSRGKRDQLARCSHISGYPTWIFSDGSRVSSVLSPESLERYTGCRLQEKNYFID